MNLESANRLAMWCLEHDWAHSAQVVERLTAPGMYRVDVVARDSMLLPNGVSIDTCKEFSLINEGTIKSLLEWAGY